MKWKFEPSDFALLDIGIELSEAELGIIAKFANAKLDEWRAKATVVYGKPDTAIWRGTQERITTHRALLIDIEELKKEPCKHEVVPKITQVDSHGRISLSDFQCKHCGVKLVAEWREVADE